MFFNSQYLNTFMPTNSGFYNFGFNAFPQQTFTYQSNNPNYFDFLFKESSSQQVSVTEEVLDEATQVVPEDLEITRKQRREAVRIAKKDETLGKEFLSKVKQVAKSIRCNYKDLLAIMNSESALNYQAVNSQTGATGLIQFMPATARELGTSTEELLQMSPIEQMDYVEKYFLRMKQIAGIDASKKLDGGDLYALTFLPARANREVLTTSDEKYYTYNKGLDSNTDGQITKTELNNRVVGKRVNESVFT